MLFTNLSDNLDSVPSEIVLHPHVSKKNSLNHFFVLFWKNQLLVLTKVISTKVLLKISLEIADMADPR